MLVVVGSRQARSLELIDRRFERIGLHMAISRTTRVALSDVGVEAETGWGAGHRTRYNVFFFNYLPGTIRYRPCDYIHNRGTAAGWFKVTLYSNLCAHKASMTRARASFETFATLHAKELGYFRESNRCRVLCETKTPYHLHYG